MEWYTFIYVAAWDLLAAPGLRCRCLAEEPVPAPNCTTEWRTTLTQQQSTVTTAKERARMPDSVSRGRQEAPSRAQIGSLTGRDRIRGNGGISQYLRTCSPPGVVPTLNSERNAHINYWKIALTRSATFFISTVKSKIKNNVLCFSIWKEKSEH